MKTKREVLKVIAENGYCRNIPCSECPYDKKSCPKYHDLHTRLIKIGAKALLRMFPEKREFDSDKILTCITADKAKVGMKGYFGDDLVELKSNFKGNIIHILLGVCGENCTYRFKSEHLEYALFYPIDEVEE